MPAGVPIRTYGVFSPEGADRLLAGSVARYRKDSRPYAETAAFFGDGLLTSQDERWHRQRRFVAPLFTPRRISGDYTPVLVQEAARMRATWAVAPDATADVHALSVAYTLRAIGRVLFGAGLDDVLPRLGPVLPEPARTSRPGQHRLADSAYVADTHQASRKRRSARAVRDRRRADRAAARCTRRRRSAQAADARA